MSSNSNGVSPRDNQVRELFECYDEIEQGPMEATRAKVDLLQHLFPDISLEGFQEQNLTSGRQLLSPDTANNEILKVFKEKFPNREALAAHYLGLDTWETDGNKTEAVDRIVKCYLSNDDSLDLSELQLTSLPDSFGNHFLQLEKLCLSGNNLIALPDWFGNLSKLKYLLLGANNLRALPDSFGNLERLEDLRAGR